jgi:non-ribosomal peptide synthetase component E (peptide arylation enzyme)
MTATLHGPAVGQPPTPAVPAGEALGTVAAAFRHARSLHSHRPAVLTDTDTLTHGDLDRLVRDRAQRLDVPRRHHASGSLVVLELSNDLASLVDYLAVLDSGHVPLLAGRHAASVFDVWSADAMIGVHHGERRVIRRSEATPSCQLDACAALHPELAVLMSTSGSTGAPKLVRLSHRNVLSNAAAIAASLALTDDDRAITTLPMHYCYGLSVVHSHLLVGGSIVLTEASVVDRCFQRQLAKGVTTFAGVPHTFELLERSTTDLWAAATLRRVTQAGGRMAPETVRRWSQQAAAHDAEFIVMYGQTEATARMAVLPAELAGRWPQSIGKPIPGGVIEIRPHPAVADAACGEVVYRGPNVMMGYAQQPADLSLGPLCDELRTGDVGRVIDGADGLIEVVGRLSRFVKPFGLRVDLAQIERHLAARGVRAAAAGDDAGLVMVVETQATSSGVADEAASAVVELTGLPRSAVQVVARPSLPRTASGKIDYSAALALRAAEARAAPAAASSPAGAVFADVLGGEVRPTDTFVGLGGDSLSYVECSIALEAAVGPLPADWHLRTVAELDACSREPRRWPRVDTTVLLRAFSICAVVATHMRLYRFPGGAHLLLAVAGYNLARFHLPLGSVSQRVRSGLRTAAKVGAPASAWIGLNMLVAGGYSVGALALVNNYTGSEWRREGRWQYWFFEVFVQLVVASVLLLAVPAVRRVERRWPFGFAATLLAALLLFRFEVVTLGGNYNSLFRTHTVAWLFALGWAIWQAERRWQQVAVSAAALLAVPGFFGRPQREVFVVGGLLLLTWLPSVPLPRPIVAPLGVLASASMWIFLVHWQVFPPVDAVLLRPYAYVVTIAAGLGAWWAADRLGWALSQTVAAFRRGGAIRSRAGEFQGSFKVVS